MEEDFSEPLENDDDDDDDDYVTSNDIDSTYYYTTTTTSTTTTTTTTTLRSNTPLLSFLLQACGGLRFATTPFWKYLRRPFMDSKGHCGSLTFSIMT